MFTIALAVIYRATQAIDTNRVSLIKLIKKMQRRWREKSISQPRSLNFLAPPCAAASASQQDFLLLSIQFAPDRPVEKVKRRPAPGLGLAWSPGMRLAFSMLQETLYDWWDDGVSRLAAALSYYTTFAIAPLLVLVIALTGALFGEEAVRGQLEQELSSLVGSEAATLIQGMIAKAGSDDSAGWASALGILALLFGATGVFVELQNALNIVWEVKPKSGRGIIGFLQTRILSFAMVLGIGFILLVSLVVSAALAALTSSMGRFALGEAVLTVFSLLSSFITITLLFAMIYKYLPDVRIGWRDVWVGAAATSVLFTAGKWLIGLYLGRSAITSTYGAAAALAILLLWVYYSAQIVLLGAEFTQVYARRFGRQILPDSHAIPLERKESPA